jgi:hypothetical protein
MRIMFDEQMGKHACFDGTSKPVKHNKVFLLPAQRADAS